MARSVSPGRVALSSRSPPVRLVPMTDCQREDALEEEAVEYADAKVRAGIWSREEALDRSHAEIRGLVGARPE